MKWTTEKDEALKAIYPHTSDRTVADRMGISLHSMKARAKRLGLRKEESYRLVLEKQRKEQLRLSAYRYTYNHTYFSVLDSREKAYWLGWMWSDGYVSQRGESYEIAIEIHTRDISILRQFKEAIQTDRPFYSRRDAVQLGLSSQQMFKDLEKYGIVPRKSTSAMHPTIQTDFISDFIRGVFDGDGCISGGKHPQVTIVGTEAFCRWLQNIVQEAIGVGGTVALKKNTTFRWILSGRTNLTTFARWMYQPFPNGEQAIYLERKHQRFVEAGLL